MKNAYFVVLAIFCAFLTGCAGGRNYDYSVSPINVDIDGKNQEITLGVHDQRDYVKSGEKSPQYVGTQRSVAYVPWNINTKSGLPMADDFLESIEKSLESKNFTVNSVTLSEKENKKEVMVHLKKTGNKRLLLFTINKWFFDIFYKTRMSYSMMLEVFNSKGMLLAKAEEKNEMWEETDNAIPDAEFQLTIKTLLNNQNIIKVIDQR